MTTTACANGSVGGWGIIDRLLTIAWGRDFQNRTIAENNGALIFINFAVKVTRVNVYMYFAQKIII